MVPSSTKPVPKTSSSPKLTQLLRSWLMSSSRTKRPRRGRKFPDSSISFQVESASVSTSSLRFSGSSAKIRQKSGLIWVDVSSRYPRMKYSGWDCPPSPAKIRTRQMARSIPKSRMNFRPSTLGDPEIHSVSISPSVSGTPLPNSSVTEFPNARFLSLGKGFRITRLSGWIRTSFKSARLKSEAVPATQTNLSPLHGTNKVRIRNPRHTRCTFYNSVFCIR